AREALGIGLEQIRLLLLRRHGHSDGHGHDEDEERAHYLLLTTRAETAIMAEGHPDPDGFAGEHAQAARREKAGAYWRHLNGAPREEITVVAEGGEKRDAAAAVRERVQRPVGHGHCRKPHEQRQWVRWVRRVRWVRWVRPKVRAVRQVPRGNGADDRSEEERVGKPSVAEHVLVADAERERDDIDVRQHRADDRPPPERRGHPAPPLARCGGDNGMTKNRGHGGARGAM